MNKKRTKINLMKITVRELIDKLPELPISGSYNDVSFQLTKEKSANNPDLIFYVLRVTGPSESNRQSVIAKFIELLGNPIMEFPAKALPNTDSLFWDAKQIDEEAVN